MDRREGTARHRQKHQEADAAGAVGLRQGIAVQPGAEVFDLLPEGGALVRPGAAHKGGRPAQVGDQVVGAVIEPGVHPVAGRLLFDPVHRRGQRLLALGDLLVGPDGAAFRLIQVDAEEDAGPGQQPGAAVFLLVGGALQLPAAQALARGGAGRGAGGGGRGRDRPLGQALGPGHTPGQQRCCQQRRQHRQSSFGHRLPPGVQAGSTRRGLPSASASSVTVWSLPSLPSMSASATGSSSVLRMVRRSSRAPNRVEVAWTMAVSASGV